ncbi:MAG: T9SS type A sorting domain-containing protein [Flavobacteriales bacterium]|nr:T9SS type A sorting domain-containing protein [Flavobacteriales bacterium]
MKTIITVFLFIVALHCSTQQLPQSSEETATRITPQFEVNTTAAVFLGKTKSVRELLRLRSTSLEKLEKHKLDKKAPDNFKGRHGSNAIMPEKEHQGPDPLRQMQRGGGNVIEPIVNIDGLGDFCCPHDPTGEVGLDHFVQAINVTDVGVYTKEGVLVEQFAMATLWQDLGVGSAGDPIVLYDETAGRWLITEFNFNNSLLVAISLTPDPLGSYYAYMFTTPNFPDYPKYSIWPDSYLVTTNEGGAGTHTQYFIDRNAMLNGEATVTIQQVEILGNNNTEQGFFISTPVDWDGEMLPDTYPVVLSLDDSSWGNADDDSIRIITFHVDYDDPDNTSVNEISLVCTPYDSFPCSVFGPGFACVPQLGGNGLDAIPEVLMNIPKYRNFGTYESIVCCFVTDVTDGDNLSGIRWMEMRRADGGEWLVHQEGTYAPADGYDRYMGSVAIDEDGNIGLGYTVSSEEIYAGLRYTGRLLNDPLGQMTVQEYVVVDGDGPMDSFGRYGDYAHMSVDPVNGNTFWFTSEYPRSGGSGIGTRIVAFELRKDTFDLAVTQLISPVTAGTLSSAELLTIEIRNVGLQPMAGYTLSFDFEGSLQETVIIPSTLNPDETFIHQFTVPMNMSANGTYEIAAHVNHPDDTGEFNNTLTTEVINLYSLDAEVELTIPAVICGTEVTVPFIISNLGADELLFGEINVYVNGLLVQTISWVGSIPYGESASIDIAITDLPTGDNEILIEFVNPNGNPDELPANNSLTAQTFVQGAGGGIQILIYTDFYPEETTWELLDQNQNVIAEGGPYTEWEQEYLTEHCINPFECYTFIIYDAYSDGICCYYGEGFYQILDSDGNIIASGGEFGQADVVEICLITCTLTADVDITTDSGLNDGAILITAMNGVEEYQYSIDGGETFQTSPLFENIPAGSYDVVVLSGDGICTFEQTITVLLVFVSEINEEVHIMITPNPSDGYFQVELSGIPAGIPSLNFQVLDATGKLVQEKSMSRYDGTFKTRVSLVAYPHGLYYLRFLDGHINELIRVVKR